MRFAKTLLTTALLGASLFSFHSTAWADTPEQQFQQGVTAYKQSDYQAEFWLSQAERGYADAQFYLGGMYFAGHRVKQDYVEAVKWFRKSAEQGDAQGQLILGISYLSGRGIQKDRTLAKEWLGKACDNGYQDDCEYYGKLNRGER